MTARRQTGKTKPESYRELLEITRLITGSLDYSLVLGTVASEAARLLEGQAAAILLLDAEGKLRVAASHNIPAECVAEVQISLDPNLMPSLRSLCADIALAAFVGVPMVLRGQTIGVLAVYIRMRRKPRVTDEELLSALADQAAIAIDNARLYRAEQKARKEAEDTANRIISLQSITAGLSQALTPHDVAGVIVDQGMAALGASAGLIALLVDRDSYLEIVRARGYPNELLEKWQRFPVSTRDPMADVVRTGSYIFLESREMLSSQYPDPAAAPFIASGSAFVALPLVLKGKVLGSLGFAFVDSQEFGREDRAFLIAIAWQCAQALDRARLYEAEQAARNGAEAAQERTAEILEGIADAFFAVDRQWRFVFVNREAARRLGKEREDLIGKNIWDEFPEIVGSPFGEQLRKAVSSQTEAAGETRCPVIDNPIEIHLFPSKRGLSVYFHDVLDRKSL